METGLAIAIAASLLIVLYKSAYTATDVLGRLPGTRCYRDVQQYPEAEVYGGLLIVSIRAPLYFVNAANVRQQICHLLGEQTQLNGTVGVEFIILERSAVAHIDSSAMHQLHAMIEEYRSRGQELVFSNPSLNVMEQLEASGVAGTIGDEVLFTSLHDAVSWCLLELDTRSSAVSSNRGVSLDGSNKYGLAVDHVMDIEVNHNFREPPEVDCPAPWTSSVSQSVRSLERRKRRPSV